MTTETILLVGRNTGYLGSLLETHAERLRRRTEASVEVASVVLIGVGV